MQNSHQSNALKLLSGGLILLGLVLIFVGVVISPAFVAERFSSDGTLALSSIIKIWIFRILTGMIGLLSLLYGFLKWTGSASVQRIDSMIKEGLVARFRQPGTIVIIVFILLGLFSFNRAVNLAAGHKWKNVIGYEYYWIAESLAGGHGYSLPANHRWYFFDFKSEYPADEYYPTALEEPVYPALLAMSFKYFKPYGKLIILLLQIAALYGTAVMLYLLIKMIFDSHLGIVASMWLLLRWPETYYLSERVFSPAIFAGLSICLSAILVLWSLERISVKRGLMIGCVLGCSCMLLASSLLLIPITMLLTIGLKRPLRPLAWKPAMSIAIAAVIVLSPWIVRNLVVFGKLIPVRTGFGLILHQSNVALSATFSEGRHACHDALGPIWQAKDSREALEEARNVMSKRMDVYKRSYECIEFEAPADYSVYNEVQREDLYLKKSLAFLAANPDLFINLTFTRIKAFFSGWRDRHTVVFILALVGAVISWRNQRSAIMVLLLLGYSFTFSLAGAWMYRYRYPVENLMFVLASGVLIFIVEKIRSRLTIGKHAQDGTTTNKG